MLTITKTVKIKDKDVKDILDEIDDWYGVRVTPSILKKILNKNKRLLGDISEYESYGLDTALREDIVNALALDLIGEEWPIYSDSQKKRTAFFKKFEKKAKTKRGYEFIYEK